MPIYLDREIAAGDPVNHFGLDSRITEKVATLAELRAFVVRHAGLVDPSRPESTNIHPDNVAQINNARIKIHQLLD